MKKEVSRKDFLGILGLAAVFILGFGHIIQLLTGRSLDRRVDLTHGHSSGAYGGGSKRE